MSIDSNLLKTTKNISKNRFDYNLDQQNFLTRTLDDDQNTDRKSDATTLKESSKNESEENERDKRVNTRNVKSSKYSENIMSMNSPLLTQKNRKEKQSLDKLMEELSKTSTTNRRAHESNQNMKNSLNSFWNQASRSLKDDELEILRYNKISMINTETASNVQTDNPIDIRLIYESELKQLRESLLESNKREKDMRKRIEKLEVKYLKYLKF